MKKCNKFRKMTAEAIYSELNEKQSKEFFSHLELCSTCGAEFSELKRTLEMTNQWQRHDPGEEFWENYWLNLEAKLDAADHRKGLLRKIKDRYFSVRINFFRLAPQLGAAMVILIFGILIGKFFFSEKPHEIKTENQYVRYVQPTGPMMVLAEKYLEKSKIILLGLINFDPDKDDPYVLNMNYQKEISQQLAYQATYLKNALSDSGHVGLADLIEELEIIMLQIANLETENDLQGIEIIKTGVERNGILLQIFLEEMEMSGQKGDNHDAQKTTAKI